MGCTISTAKSSSSSTSGNIIASGGGKWSDVLVKRALNVGGNSNQASEVVLLHCGEIQSLLKEKVLLREKEGKEDSSEALNCACDLDRTSEDYIKQRLHNIVSQAKGCPGKQEFLRSSCLNEMLIIQNMIRRSHPKTATNLKFVLKVALDLVEKNLEVDTDSVSDRIHNLTPFSSRTNLNDGVEDGAVAPRSSTLNPASAVPSATQSVQEGAPTSFASASSSWTSFTGKTHQKDLTSSHHGSTSSFEEFGFFDLSTHSVKKENMESQSRKGMVQLQLAKAIDNGVSLSASGTKSFCNDELGGRSHG